MIHTVPVHSWHRNMYHPKSTLQRCNRFHPQFDHTAADLRRRRYPRHLVVILLLVQDIHQLLMNNKLFQVDHHHQNQDYDSHNRLNQ